MEEYENILLEKLKKITSGIKEKTLENKLKALKDKEADKSKKKILNSIISIMEGNKFINENPFLRFKNKICKMLLEIIENTNYNQGYFIDLLTTDKNLEKLIYFSGLISIKFRIKKKISPTNILFEIFNKKEFESLKLNIKEFKDINSNDFFVYLILRNETKKLIDEFNRVNPQNNNNINTNINFDSFIKYNNEDFLNYINNDMINVIENNNNIDKGDNNEETKNQNIIIINEDANSNIINDDDEKEAKKAERLGRIKQLINKSVCLPYDAELPEKTIIDSNYKRIDKMNENSSFEMNEILIDNNKFEDLSKLYLFTPIFLVINNLKKDFERNDFEIFNNDNYYFELFGKYLEEIIEKLNGFINEGINKSYIEENKIKIGCYHEHYYLCCKMNDDFKKKYYDNKIISEENIIENYNNDIKVIRVRKDNKDNANKDSEKDSEIKNDNSELLSTYSSAKIAKENFRNKVSNTFENKVSQFLLDASSENLQNLVLFFNLKVSKKMVRKFYLNQLDFLLNNQSTNNLYGFREIDICFLNKNERIIEKDILCNNIKYNINTRGKLKEQNPQDIEVFLKQNSIVFCEVKSSFPNVTCGNEKYHKLEIPKKNEEFNNSNYEFTYIDQIDNLIKKAKLFFNLFIDENIINEQNFFHILYLYDEEDINLLKPDFQNIKNNISNFLKKQFFPKKMKNVIFQVVYFDKEKNEQRIQINYENKIKELEEFIKGSNPNYNSKK